MKELQPTNRMVVRTLDEARQFRDSFYLNVVWSFLCETTDGASILKLRVLYVHRCSFFLADNDIARNLISTGGTQIIIYHSSLISLS